MLKRKNGLNTEEICAALGFDDSGVFCGLSYGSNADEDFSVKRSEKPMMKTPCHLISDTEAEADPVQTAKDKKAEAGKVQVQMVSWRSTR